MNEYDAYLEESDIVANPLSWMERMFPALQDAWNAPEEHYSALIQDLR